MDTVNSFSALDSPDRVAEDLVPYLSNLHIKDFDITRVDHQMGFIVLGKPAGYGKLNIPALLERIRGQNRIRPLYWSLDSIYRNRRTDRSARAKMVRGKSDVSKNATFAGIGDTDV